MQVSEFIISQGIQDLSFRYVIQNGKMYKIVVNIQDIETHSKSAFETERRFIDYHRKGSYRFYACNEKDMCVWVYGSSEIFTESEATALLNKQDCELSEHFAKYL